MRRIAKHIVLFFALSLCLTADSASRRLAPVWAEALQGNEKKALAVLEKIPADRLDAKETSARACLRKTFVDKKPGKVDAPDAFVAGVIGIFRDYWTRVLLQELSVAQGEDFLFAQLKAFVARNGDTTIYAALDDLDEALGPMLLAHGVHSVRGVTRPYYELMTWSEEQAKSYEVALPETKETAKVVFMSKFTSLGWSAFATCGAAESGGWTKPEALYCVADAYDTKSEAFAVSYLAHEAQHFADNKQFPKLAQPELEYRAKLTELAKADKTAHALIAQFASQAGPSRDAPHAFADQKVVSDLSRALFANAAIDDKRLGEASIKAINTAAVELLKANTAALVAAGAETVSEVLK